MKQYSPRGFTLIEMVVVIAVILVLAALTVGIGGLVLRKAAESKARQQIRAMQNACEAYKQDNGTYPQNTETNALDPHVDVDPTSSAYQRASLHLYSSLSGDSEPMGTPDGKKDADTREYYSFSPKQLLRSSSGSAILSIQDPFGFTYGYSTAGSEAEVAYRAVVRGNPSAARPTQLKGNNPTVDLWSTGGGTTKEQRAKWIKNWLN